MMKGLKVGAYVNVLPSHRGEEWVAMAKWPARVTKIRDNGIYPCFELEKSSGVWGETGLVIVNKNLENK